MENIEKMERKFTDGEIVKALRCCVESSHFGECFDAECPMISEDGCDAWTDDKLLKATIDIINRQNAEIADERARKELCAEVIKRLDKESETARAEAYKEFAARVNEKLQNLARMHMQHGSDEIYFLVSESFIDNVLKELTEEKK